jgi:microcystin-dependent protein
MDQPFLGEVQIFAGTFAPRGWAFCNGQLLPIAQNQALFSLLGVMYGGNGTTNFALPNLNGRMPIGTGTGPGLSPVVAGVQLGADVVTLTEAQVPPHAHSIQGLSSPATRQAPLGQSLAVADGLAFGDTFEGLAHASLVGNAGSAAPTAVPNVQPVFAINFVIALTGIFPARN